MNKKHVDINKLSVFEKLDIEDIIAIIKARILILDDDIQLLNSCVDRTSGLLEKHEFKEYMERDLTIANEIYDIAFRNMYLIKQTLDEYNELEELEKDEQDNGE